MSNTTIEIFNDTASVTAIILTTTTSTTSIFSTASSLIVFVWFVAIAGGLCYGLGFLGNVLSLMVFFSLKDFRNISTGLLFIFFAISNFFHLWTLAMEFLTIYSIPLFRNVVFQCQITFYIQNISRAMGTYFMVTISIDRLIRSELPMRSKLICTRRNVVIITCIYLIIFALFWSFFLYPTATQNPITGSCSFSLIQSISYFISYIHAPIRAVLICFIPVVIMVAANIRMIINIRQSKRRITNGTTNRSTETNITNPNVLENEAQRKRSMSALDRMLFYMMLANVSIFILTQIPFHIYSCIRNNLLVIDALTGQLIRGILLIWSSLYFGIVFYFYCFTSPLFRHKFMKLGKKILCCQTIHPPGREATRAVA